MNSALGWLLAADQRRPWCHRGPRAAWRCGRCTRSPGRRPVPWRKVNMFGYGRPRRDADVPARRPGRPARPGTRPSRSTRCVVSMTPNTSSCSTRSRATSPLRVWSPVSSRVDEGDRAVTELALLVRLLDAGLDAIEGRRRRTARTGRTRCAIVPDLDLGVGHAGVVLARVGLVDALEIGELVLRLLATGRASRLGRGRRRLVTFVGLVPTGGDEQPASTATARRPAGCAWLSWMSPWGPRAASLLVRRS